MALIPTDAALRLRLQTETNQLQPVQPVRPIPADLPELQVGQAFTARIVETLPDNTYRALVAGRTLTLSLPQGARTGDTLELVVTDRTANSIIAHLAPRQPPAASAEPYPWANFSRSGQMIAALLPREGELPPAAPLNRGQPLLASPPRSGAELVPALSQAVRQSGLFYEAHQAQWISGRLPVTQLLAEPQGALSNLAAVLARAGQTNAPTEAAATGPQSTAMGSASGSAASGPGQPSAASSPSIPGSSAVPAPAGTAADAQSNAASSTNSGTPQAANPTHAAFSTDEAAAQTTQGRSALGPPSHLLGSGTVSLTASTTDTATLPAGQSESSVRSTAESSKAHDAQLGRIIADELRPLVQQQLEALATQRMIWHGELWPRQSVELEIKREEIAERQAGSDGEHERWNTTLRLHLPRLGFVDAALSLTGHQLRLVMLTPHESSAADLRAATPRLNEALEAAGLELVAWQIRSLDGDSKGQPSG